MHPSGIDSNPEELWGLGASGPEMLIDPQLLVDDDYSSNYRQPDTRDIAPLKALRPSSIKLLATFLNPTKIMPTENGLLRDWRGLAELAGLSSESITYLESKEDPTTELIRIWMRQEPRRSTDDLKAFLAVIDRFDVCDDVEPFLESDIAFFWTQTEKVREGSSSQNVTELATDDSNLLTIGDTQSETPTRYDAFILYADEDSEFALQIVDKMENEYNLKMCVKDRDLLAGSMFEHEIIGRIIEQRCNRLLAVFSPNFLKSQANQFLVSYAQALALETRQRKIIPCMYIRCELPPSVRYSFCLDYNRSGKLWNFWDKLGQSLRTTPLTTAVPIPSQFNKSGSKVSASLPTHVSPLAYKDPSFGWWDSQKEKPPQMRQHSLSTSDSGVLTDVDLTPDFDTLSLQSGAHLIQGEVKSSKGKWYKKIMGSGKKKKRVKEAVLAEAI